MAARQISLPSVGRACPHIRMRTCAWLHIAGYTCHAVHNDNHMYRSTCVSFFAITNLCTREEPHLVHACLRT